MVPSAAEPPAVPFTVQVTMVLEFPDTVAMNWNESPARMLAVVGLTVTDVVAGVEGVDGLPEDVDVPLQPQVTRIASARIGSSLIAERMALRAHP